MEFSGVIPANVLPFDEDLAIDEAAYRAHIAALVSTPSVNGITCNGHAGEVASLGRAERQRAVAIAAESISGRVPLVAGIYAEHHHEARKLARDAEREGADGLLVMPPNALNYGAGDEVAYRQHAEIADAVPLPQIVFVFPAWTNMQYGSDCLARICSIPTVAAVKEWSLDIRTHEANYQLVKSMDRPISLLTSFSTNLLPALVSGADGILSGHGSVIACWQARLFKLVQAGNILEAQELYGRIQKLTTVIYRSPMINMYARMKEHLIMLGQRMHRVVRPPLWRIDKGEREILGTALETSGLLEEVINERES